MTTETLSRFRHTVAALVLAAAATAAPADPAAPGVDDAHAIVEATTRAIVGAFVELGAEAGDRRTQMAALVDSHVSPFIDYERLSRFVLGRHWRAASAAQREEFESQLRGLITRSYGAALPQIVDAEVSYREPRVSDDGSRIVVRTQVAARSGSRLEVNYYLYRGEAGWRLYDLSVEGVSLLTTYRRSFAAQLRNGTLDSLIEYMAGLNGTS